jgi:hypothetical protein
MPFIGSYNGAMKILAEIGTGTCKGSCKSVWTRNIKYALHLFTFQTLTDLFIINNIKVIYYL